jgi:hypothetical protein
MLPPSLLSSLAQDVPLETLIVGGESSEVVARWSAGRRLINA